GRVGEEDQIADAGDRGLVHDDLSTAGDDLARHGVHVRDGDGALEADHGWAGDQLAALLQGAAYGGAVAGGDLVEVRRSPGGEPPAEHVLVEAPGRGDVVGVDGEVRDVEHGCRR